MMQSSWNFLFLFSLITLSQCYDHEKARRFGAYSYITYCKPSRIPGWDVGAIGDEYPNIYDIVVIQSTALDLLAYVAYLPRDDAIVVVFRGTNNNQNWISNVKMGWTTYYDSCNCKVHNGFYGDYKRIQTALLEQLALHQENHRGARLYVTGHSLGGALANLFTGDLYRNGTKVDYLLTIGSPRVGDANYVKWLENEVLAGTEHYRITHAHDPVPHIPQNFLGYHHIDNEIYYADQDFIVCAIGEDTNCSINVSYSPLTTGDHSTYLGLSSKIIEAGCA